jgi:TDG/mug DNA glycosylase family protein
MLRDFLAPNLKAIFCGTAAGTRSATIGHYYAGRGNRFWKTIHEIGLTDRTLLPEQDSTCLEYGFGLTDLAKGVAGMDKAIPNEAFDSRTIHSVIDSYRPRVLAFNGKKAAQTALDQKHLGYGLWKTIGTTKVWILPSTSGAANGHWSITPWLEMASTLRLNS